MKNLTKLTALTLTAALALTACGSSAAATAPAAESAAGSTAEAASGDLLSEIQAKGTITVAMEGTWAPWTYHDENDNLVGYDVEVATEIAKKLGVEPQFVEGEWDGLLAGLDAGRYDIMVNGVDITPERAEKYDFSTPYAFNRTAVITKADDDSINTLEDLKGKKTANTISSTYAELAEQYGAHRRDAERRDDLLRLHEGAPRRECEDRRADRRCEPDRHPDAQGRRDCRPAHGH